MEDGCNWLNVVSDGGLFIIRADFGICCHGVVFNDQKYLNVLCTK
jgi:hypothetical protein